LSDTPAATGVGAEAIVAVDGAPPSARPHGISLTLEDVSTVGGRRLRASARAASGARLDAIGVRLHLSGANRLLVDGYHSWDWAGLRDFEKPGAAWWGAVVGTSAARHPLTVRLERPPSRGALHLRWPGDGTLDVLTTGPPTQEWERSGTPTSLGGVLGPARLSSDPVLLAPLGPGGARGAALPELRELRRPGARLAGWMSWNCRGPAVTAADARAALALVPPPAVAMIPRMRSRIVRSASSGDW